LYLSVEPKPPRSTSATRTKRESAPKELQRKVATKPPQASPKTAVAAAPRPPRKVSTETAEKPPRPTKLVDALVNQNRKMVKSVNQPMKSVDKSPPSTPPNTKRQRSSSAVRAAPIVQQQQQQHKLKLTRQSPSPPRVDEKAAAIVRHKPIRKPVDVTVDTISPVPVVNGIDSPPTMPQPPIDIEQELHEGAMNRQAELPPVEIDSVLIDVLDMPSPTVTGEYNRQTRSVEPADEHASESPMSAHTPPLLIDVMNENVAVTSSQPLHGHSPSVESTNAQLQRPEPVC
jgi:hypothetical protein